MLPLKKGAFRLAQNTGLPIMPVGIAGTYEIAPPKKLPTRWGHQVTLVFGEPFWVPPSETLDAAMERFRKELVQLVEEARASRLGR